MLFSCYELLPGANPNKLLHRVEKYKDITELLLKHLRQELTQDESAYLTVWVEESEKNRQLFDDINNTATLMAEVRAYGEAKHIDLDAMWAKVKVLGSETAFPNQQNKIVRLKWWRRII